MSKGEVSGDGTALLLSQPGLSYEYVSNQDNVLISLRASFALLRRIKVSPETRREQRRPFSRRARVTSRWKRAEGLDEEVSLPAKSRRARWKGGL